MDLLVDLLSFLQGWPGFEAEAGEGCNIDLTSVPNGRGRPAAPFRHTAQSLRRYAAANKHAANSKLSALLYFLRATINRTHNSPPCPCYALH